MRKTKSVLVLTTSFPLDSTSIATGSFVFENCRHLINKGLNVKVIAPHSKKAKTKEIIDGVEIIRFKYFFPAASQILAYGAGIPFNFRTSYLAKLQLPFFMLAFIVATIKEARNYDIIHCHWSIAGLIGILAAKLFKKKVVLTMHGAEIFVYGDNPLLRYILKNVDFLICNSTFTEKKTLAVFHPKNHIVIPVGIDIKRFTQKYNSIEIRRRLNISQNDIFILAIGNFIPRKGFEYLIEAVNIIVNQMRITHIKIGIGGRGPLRNRYENIIKKYSLGNYVIFIGHIDDEDLPSFYSTSDIFVLPSIIDARGDTEGLGVVLLEANACQIPVIGSRVGGIPDIIKDGINGLLALPKNPRDLAEKIMKLAVNKKLREQMGKNGRCIVSKNFNWEVITKMVVNIYDSTVVSN